MLVTSRANTRVGRYKGFTTNLLIGELNSGSREISIQITDVDPGEMQFLHSHEEEQCYYLVRGAGSMIIDGENRAVKEGEAIFVPSGSKHGIKNIGDDTLTYLTANKAFGKQREGEIWPE